MYPRAFHDVPRDLEDEVHPEPYTNSEPWVVRVLHGITVQVRYLTNGELVWLVVVESRPRARI